MLPVLQVGPLAIPTFALACLLAYWATLAVGARLAGRLGFDGDHLYNAGLYGAITGLLVARLAHVVAFWPAYRSRPLDIIGLNARAFILWPGLLAGLLVVMVYLRRHRLSWAAILDATAAGALVGASLIALGAFLAGRGVGAPTSLPWGITQWGVTRHPAQLYEMGWSLAAAAMAIWVVRRQHQPGMGAWVALLGYGLGLWLLEPFRAAEASAITLGGLRLAQVLGLAAALAALWGLRARAGRPDGGRDREQ